MRSQLAILLALTLTLTGCSSLSFRQEPPVPAVLSGSNQEIREKLLQEIPIGSSRADAERAIRSLGLEPQPEADLDSGKPLILCSYSGRKGLMEQNTWLIQIDCPDGQVTDVFCEQIGTD
jgi:hypothetical protein